MSARTHDQPETKAASPAKDEATNSVEILDASGQPLGFTITHKGELVDIEDEPDEAPERLAIRRLAKSVSGWSAFYVDGEKLAFSQARAAELFTRFPHIAAQVERAIKS